jgi:hypothetical protein
MDTSPVNAASSLVTSMSGDNAAGAYVLKKSLDIQKESATQLINSLPQPAKVNDPTATIGRNIDTKA